MASPFPPETVVTTHRAQQKKGKRRAKAEAVIEAVIEIAVSEELRGTAVVQYNY